MRPRRRAPSVIGTSGKPTGGRAWGDPSIALRRRTRWETTRRRPFTTSRRTATSRCSSGTANTISGATRSIAGGRQINVMEKQIDFVMGSGNHARAYLHRTARNTLVELPLGWYAEKGGYWAMNPGYDRPDHEGFRRKITYDCMFCHNGYPKIPAGNDRPFAESVYAGSAAGRYRLPAMPRSRAQARAVGENRGGQAGRHTQSHRQPVAAERGTPGWRCACSAISRPRVSLCRTRFNGTSGARSSTGPASR